MAIASPCPTSSTTHHQRPGGGPSVGRVTASPSASAAESAPSPAAATRAREAGRCALATSRGPGSASASRAAPAPESSGTAASGPVATSASGARAARSVIAVRSAESVSHAPNHGPAVPGSAISATAASHAADSSSPHTGTAARLAKAPTHEKAWKRHRSSGIDVICALTVGTNGCSARRKRPQRAESHGPIVTRPTVAAHESWKPRSPAQAGARTRSGSTLRASAWIGSSARSQSRAQALAISEPAARASDGRGPASPT